MPEARRIDIKYFRRCSIDWRERPCCEREGRQKSSTKASSEDTTWAESGVSEDATQYGRCVDSSIDCDDDLIDSDDDSDEGFLDYDDGILVSRRARLAEDDSARCGFRQPRPSTHRPSTHGSDRGPLAQSRRSPVSAWPRWSAKRPHKPVSLSSGQARDSQAESRARSSQSSRAASTPASQSRLSASRLDQPRRRPVYTSRRRGDADSSAVVVSLSGLLRAPRIVLILAIVPAPSWASAVSSLRSAR